MRIFHIQLDFATIVHIEDRQAYKNVKNALNLKLKLVEKLITQLINKNISLLNCLFSTTCQSACTIQ